MSEPKAEVERHVEALDAALLRIAHEGNTRDAVVGLIDAAADIVTDAHREQSARLGRG